MPNSGRCAEAYLCTALDIGECCGDSQFSLRRRLSVRAESAPPGTTSSPCVGRVPNVRFCIGVGYGQASPWWRLPLDGAAVARCRIRSAPARSTGPGHHLRPRSSSAQGLGERPLQPGEVVGLAVMVRRELVGPADRGVPYIFAGTLDKRSDIADAFGVGHRPVAAAGDVDQRGAGKNPGDHSSRW
jgi:hypothetical protein